MGFGNFGVITIVCIPILYEIILLIIIHVCVCLSTKGSKKRGGGGQ